VARIDNSQKTFESFAEMKTQATQDLKRVLNQIRELEHSPDNGIVYSFSINQDNFQGIAKLWAKANPDMLVSYIKVVPSPVSGNWCWGRPHEDYTIVVCKKDVPIKEIIEDWVKTLDISTINSLPNGGVLLAPKKSL